MKSNFQDCVVLMRRGTVITHMLVDGVKRWMNVHKQLKKLWTEDGFARKAGTVVHGQKAACFRVRIGPFVGAGTAERVIFIR